MIAWEEVVSESRATSDVKSAKVFSEFDCSGRYRMIQIDAMDWNDTFSSESKPGEWSYISPDSSEEMYVTFICKGDLTGSHAIAPMPVEFAAQMLLKILDDPSIDHTRR